jgi:Mobilization protein NikA
MTNETRDRRCPLRVIVSASERSRIEERARSAGLSVSAYLRTAGLCHPIRSAFDHEAVVELAKVNGDQGRLGGLLKLWLADRPGIGAPETDVRLLLDRIAELQGRLAEIAGRI